jgi:hypothetical protein
MMKMDTWSRSDEYNRSYNKKYRDNIKDELIRFHGGKCENCGIEYDYNNMAIFDFHHLNPETKTKNSRNNCSLEKRKEESENCVMLCANCHRLVHAKKLFFSGDDSFVF